MPHLGVPFLRMCLGPAASPCWWWSCGSPVGSGDADVQGPACRGMEGSNTMLHPFQIPPPFGGDALSPSLGTAAAVGSAMVTPLCVHRPPPRCTRRSSVAASRSWRGCGSAARPRHGRQPRQHSGDSRSCSSRCCSCSRRRSSCRRTLPSCCRSGSSWNVAVPPSNASAPSWHPGSRRPSGR